MIFLWHPSLPVLSQMADGALAATAHQRCQRHVAACAHCQKVWRALWQVKMGLKRLLVVEENPLEQLQPPVFIPVIRPAFPGWGFAAGVVVGMLILALVMALRPVHPAMRVISANADGLAGPSELAPGVPLSTSTPADVDLEIPGQVLLRLKPGTTITWEELNRFWMFGRRPNLVVHVMRGQMLARTQDAFWGSRLQIYTPTAAATVKGTAFAVQVDPERVATTLKVLAGSVFFSPYLGNVGVRVVSGEQSRIVSGNLPARPQALPPQELQSLLEVYRIGKDPSAALVIGAGPERVDEFLKPALLYLSMEPQPELHTFIRKLVWQVNAALLEGNLASRRKELAVLEATVREMTVPELVAPIRLYLGACYMKLGEWRRGRAYLHWVADHLPQQPLASLALAALGRHAERSLKNPDLAQGAFHQLLQQYPASPEAALAREFSKRYPTRRSP